MRLLNKLRILFQGIRERSNPHPPTIHEWSDLPEFVKQQLFYTVFDAANGWDGEIYIAHWIR